MKILALTAHTDLPEAHLLRRLAEEGVGVTVGSPPEGVKQEVLRDSGVQQVNISFASRFAPLAQLALRRLVIREKYDLIHYFSARALSNGLLALRGLPCRHVAYRGTMGHLSRLDPSSWFSFLNPRLDAIVCVSEAVRRYLIAVGLPENRVFTIYKGHELSWYAKEPLDLATIGIPRGAFVVAMAANMRRVKGAHVLLEAIKLLNPKHPIHIVLIGEVRDTLVEQLLRELEGNPRLHVLGFRSDVAQIVASADAFVMPSIAREGLPKAVIEAMACKVAPIVSDVGGMPELVVNETSGLVVPPSDPPALARAIERLFESPELSRRFGLAAQERVRSDFALETTVRRTVELYHNLLAGEQ